MIDIDITAIAVVGIIFSTIYGLFYIIVRRRERLTMMEKGYDAKFFYTENPSTSFSSLKFGMLFVGVGAGILFGNILSVTTALHEEVAFFSMIFLCGGLALVLNYIIEKKEKSSK
ncbi:MAG: hypothetical protein Q8T08_10100 [Ignavibacteria bacterium]|nr:hypothetical protein [Ignavibacteria bacterium]